MQKSINSPFKLKNYRTFFTVIQSSFTGMKDDTLVPNQRMKFSCFAFTDAKYNNVAKNKPPSIKAHQQGFILSTVSREKKIDMKFHIDLKNEVRTCENPSLVSTFTFEIHNV